MNGAPQTFMLAVLSAHEWVKKQITLALEQAGKQRN